MPSITRDDVLRVVNTQTLREYLDSDARVGLEGFEGVAFAAHEELCARELVDLVTDGDELEPMKTIAIRATAVIFANSEKDSVGLEDFAREQAEIVYDVAYRQIVERLSVATDPVPEGHVVSLAARMVGEDINEHAQQLVEQMQHESGVEPL